ncbi:MAG: NADH:ubiquinone reductase (Na(+)-transporting) subunit C [Bacteroidales bacterium]|nr:NADH:ubiquinone reductase (Na(+)-transporting) subunit C [Bacteroidales bacterium]
MNTNSNTYTIIYTTVVCVLVAAILAIVSGSLASKQQANEKAETISQILTAAGFADKSEWEARGNDAIISFYKENICNAYVIDAAGTVKDSLDTASATIYNLSELKKQNYSVTDAASSQDLALPVYMFKDSTYVLPVYGAGLWGPVWGYVALENDLTTIKGAYFDHASETPGLGGKIKDDPSFRAQFSGKVVDFTDVKPFAIVKGGAGDKANGIDAISGATMTSKGLDAAINNWLAAYKPYLVK